MVIDLEFTIIEVVFILLIVFFMATCILIISIISQQKERNRLISAFVQFYAKNEILKGVSGGLLNGQQCYKCNNLFVPELFSHKTHCPFCSLSYKKGNVIFEHKGKVKSRRKKVYDYLAKKGNTKIIKELW